MLNQKIIDKVRKAVVQIATPFSTGTGFYIAEYGLIVTNEHVVRDNLEVVIKGESFDKQSVKVVFLDERYDLAFLLPPLDHTMDEVTIDKSLSAKEGQEIIAVGHPFGLSFSATQGIISSTTHHQHSIDYIQHDAALNPGNSGGPLINSRAHILGVNTFIMKQGNSIGFSLPIHHVEGILNDLDLQNGTGVRCSSCENYVYERNISKSYCPFCGSKVDLPSYVKPYRPSGVKKTLEDMIEQLGYNVILCRKGPNQWEIEQGSARINLSYHEDSGQICADAYLCALPKEGVQEIYTYLLKQNYLSHGLSFSVREQNIVLTLLIFDRYLEVETGLKLLNLMFLKADEYDDILIHEYGAICNVLN